MKRTKAADVSRDADGKSGERFESLLGRVIRVSKDELARREEAYQDARRDKKSSSRKT